MARYDVHSVCTKTKYQTLFCSKATLFYLICTLLTFIPPFLIAYRSEGFWKRLDWYSEQPRINFKRQLIVLLETPDENEFVAYSTYEKFNNLMGEHIRIPIIKFHQDDVNRDGAHDMLDLQLEFHLNEEHVKSLTLLLVFDYQLQKYCRLQMEGLAYIQGSSPLSGSELYYSGDLSLEQKIPLSHSGVDLRFYVPVIQSESIYAKDYDLQAILKAYSDRNVTLRVKNVYTVWKTGRGTGQPFVITVNLRYPEQLVLYKPGFWQILKWGWVQYFSILIIFIYVFRSIKTFVFENQIIHTAIRHPFKLHMT